VGARGFIAVLERAETEFSRYLGFGIIEVKFQGVKLGQMGREGEQTTIVITGTSPAKIEVNFKTSPEGRSPKGGEKDGGGRGREKPWPVEGGCA